MIINKYVPTCVNQEWHLINTNYGNDIPDEEGLYLVIIQNRDYAIAQYVYKETTLRVLDKQDKNGLSIVQIAPEDGFYTLGSFDGQRATIKKLNVIAWTKLSTSMSVFNAMCGKE